MQGHYCYKFSNFALSRKGRGLLGCGGAAGLGICRDPEEEEEKRKRGKEGGRQGNPPKPADRPG